MAKLRNVMFPLVEGLVIYLCFMGGCLGNSPKLNLPRILLPLFKTYHSNFTLEVTGGGCYEWSVTNSQIVTLTPLFREEGCSTQAVISTLYQDMRNAAIVVAEDKATGYVLRADVIVDVIWSLSIVTTTRELYMEEPPELFEVRAYDKQGNEFTTLEGVEFHWSVVGSQKDIGPVLRFISFKESPYETPKTIEAFDRVGKQGHIVLLEGVRSGQSKVSVQLLNPEYSHVPHITVTLRVVINVLLQPSEVFILENDEIDLQLFQVKNNKLRILSLSESPQFQLYIENTYVVSLTGALSIRGVSLGTASVVLIDNSSGMEHRKHAGSIIHVVKPVYMTLNCQPSWSLVQLQEATISASVFDSQNHIITFGPKSVTQIVVTNDLFTISRRVTNGSVVYGTGNNAGVGTVTGSLDLYPSVSCSETLRVFEPVKISPETIYIPWSDNLDERPPVVFKASGGDGNYVWSVKNKNVGSVNTDGQFKVKDTGTADVIVCMKNNEFSCSFAKVFVLAPNHLEVVNKVNEAPVGVEMLVHISLYASLGNAQPFPFTYCQNLNFLISHTSSFTMNNDTTIRPAGQACAVFGFTGKEVSKSLVTFKLMSKNSILKAEADISSFKPLQLMHMKPGSSVVLSLGSSQYLVFKGGPNSKFGNVWTDVSYDKSLLNMTVTSKQPELYIYNVQCIALGHSLFSLNIKTETTSANEGGPIEASVLVYCSEPHDIVLKPASDDECPHADERSGLILRNSALKIEVIIRNEVGLPFTNATSLKYNVSFTTPLITTPYPNHVNLSSITKPDYLIPEYHYVFINSIADSGETSLKLEALGYQEEVVHMFFEKENISELRTQKKAQFTPKTMFSNVQCILPIIVFEPATVEPLSFMLFNHPENVGLLNISHGSGHFKTCIAANIAQIDHRRESRTVEIKPLLSGHSSLTVQDLCSSSAPISVEVQVLDVTFVRIEMVDKVEEGQVIPLSVKLFDKEERPLSFLKVPMDNAAIQIETSNSDVAMIMNDGKPEKSKSDFLFSVTGLKVGDSTFTAKWNDLTSPPVTLQVFSSISLDPRNITLTLGAEYQINILGGPSIEQSYQFIATENIVTVSQTGLVKALHLGQTRISVLASGTYGNIHSKDFVIVNVVEWTGIRIQTPIAQLGVGYLMPAYVFGIPSLLSPFILGSINPPLSFKWSLSIPSVAQLRDPLQDANVEVNNEDRISVRVYGVAPGRTLLSVQVTGRNPETRALISYQSSVEIEIVKPLMWELPATFNNCLLAAPETSFPLKTNWDQDAVIEYSVIRHVNPDLPPPKAIQPLTVSSPSNKTPFLLTVSSTGIVTTGKQLGYALVIAKKQTGSGVVQSIAACVEVKPVEYMMLHLISSLNTTSDKLRALPCGMLLHVNVTFHDNLGRSFFSVPTDLETNVNRFDKEDITSGPVNTTIIMALGLIGNTMLHVFDNRVRTHQVEDYLKLKVHDYISPSRTVMTVGEVMCFSTPISKTEGTWESDSDVLKVEQNGVAIATKPGSAVISFKLTKLFSPIYSSVVIEVLPLQALKLQDDDVILTNTLIGSRVFIPVLLLSDKSKKDLPAVHLSECSAAPALNFISPFKCDIEFSSPQVPVEIQSLFSIRPGFDKVSGQHVCEIISLSGPSSNVSNIKSNVTIQVSTTSTGPVLHDTTTLMFHPSVYIATKSLVFTSVRSTNYITLLGTPHVLEQVMVEPSDSTMIIVGEPSVGFMKTVSYSVRLGNSFIGDEQDLSVSVISRLTRQVVKIPIMLQASQISAATQAGWISRLCDVLHSLQVPQYVILFFTLLSVLMGYIFFSGGNEPLPALNTSLNSSNLMRGISPEMSHRVIQAAMRGGQPLRIRPLSFGVNSSAQNATPSNKGSK